MAEENLDNIVETKYYENKDITVRFDVFKDGKETVPNKALVAIYDPDSGYLRREFATVDGSEVIYVLKGEAVQKTGLYVFVFGISDYPSSFKGSMFRQWSSCARPQPAPP